MKITEFTGAYRFLSNFHAAKVQLVEPHYSMWFTSVEHAYQAAKSSEMSERVHIQSIQLAQDAKKIGKRVKMRADWNEVKDDVMLKLLRSKFSNLNPELKTKLIATDGAELIEGNWWGDTYWGVCRGVGENKLGKLLMQVRSELMEELKG